MPAYSYIYRLGLVLLFSLVSAIHLALAPNGMLMDKFYLIENNKEKEVRAALGVSAGQYTINTLKYNGLSYEWDNPSKSFLNGVSRIVAQKDNDKLDRVNLFKYTGQRCEYQYVEIAWSSKDENTSNVEQNIQGKISKQAQWILYPYTERDLSCEDDFIEELLAKDRQGCNADEVAKGDKLLKDNLGSPDPVHLVNVVNSVCLSSLRKLSYQEKTALFVRIAGQESLKENSELALLRLMNALYTSDYQAFYKLLEDNNNELIRHLVNEIDDTSIWFWTDKSNYTNFIGALVTLFNQNAESIADRWVANNDDFTQRVVNLNPVAYSRDVSSLFAQSYTDKYNNGEYDGNTGNITLYDVYKTTTFGADPMLGQNNVSYDSKKEKLAELSPLTPVIIIPEQGKIPLLQSALDSYDFGNGAYVVPAIFLKYNADKIRNDYIEKGIVVTLDVATIAISGGTALATKVHWVRRAWALMEVGGAMGDIVVNAANTSPELKPAIDAYNMAMSIIGANNIRKSVVNFARELPANVKTLLQENQSIRSLVAARYLDWQITLYSIDELTEVEQQLLAKQVQVWRVLDINTAAINNINDFWTRIPAEYLDNIKKAFDGVPTTVKYAEKDMILYRHISVDGPEISFWFSRTIESPENAKKLLALPNKNTAEWVVKVKIKEGTPYIEGKVASQANDISGTFDKNATGGGNQLYFLLEDLGNIEKMEKFINPLK